MAPKWSTADEVEYIFEETYTAGQREMIQRYIDTGERPPAGCAWCDEGFIRVLTGNMDIYMMNLEIGIGEWPWPVEEDTEVGELADDKTEETKTETKEKV